jgi:CheY-like chemotaxis protein
MNMNPKILLADDSLTIQKVVKITLSNEPYDLIECHDEASLLASIEKNQPDMVFLDFSLSSSKTGYELCREIKSVYARTKVVMMYGTFDTIEEEELKLVNASAHIVKPFDSSRFISLCSSLSSFEDDDDVDENRADIANIDHDSPHDSEALTAVDDLINEKTGDIDPGLIDQLNEDLPAPIEASEDDQWQMEVPPQMDASDSEDNFDLPPIIEEVEATFISNDDDIELPPVDDLEYPDIEAVQQELDEAPIATPTSKLVSADELAPIELINPELDTEDTDHDQVRLKELEEQIVDEIDEDDLWSADDGLDSIPPKMSSEASFDSMESTPVTQDLPPVKESVKALNDLDALFPDEPLPEFEVKIPEPINNEHLTANYSTPTNTQATDIDLDQLTSQIIEKLMPVIEQKIIDQVELMVSQEYDKRFTPSVDQAVWKLVPDLASKIINQEIEEIRKKIL